MRKAIYILIFILSQFSLAFAQPPHNKAKPKLAKRTVSNGVKIKLPKEFTPMVDSDIALRYFTHNKPLAMYTSEDRNIGFGFNVATVNWGFGEIELLRKFYKASVLSMFNKVDIIDEGVKTVKGQEYAYLEFTSSVDRIKNYFYVQYIVLNNRIFIFHTMCPAHMSKDYQETARAMMNSMKVNPDRLRNMPHQQKMPVENQPLPDKKPKPKDPARPKDPTNKEEVPSFR